MRGPVNAVTRRNNLLEGTATPRNESLDARNIVAVWNKTEKRTSPYCTMDNITLM